MGGWWRWALVSPDGVAPSWTVGVSASVNLPLHHKVQMFSSGTGSPGWSRKKGCKMVEVWWWWWLFSECNTLCTECVQSFASSCWFSNDFTFQYIHQKAIVLKNMYKLAMFPAPDGIQDTSGFINFAFLTLSFQLVT